MIRIDTDLPGGQRAKAWVSLDAIVVEVNQKYTIAVRNHLSREKLAEVAAILMEAANG